MKLTRDLPGFEGVVAGGRATLSIPPSHTIHELLLTMGGTTFTEQHIDKITIKGNGKPLFECSGNELDIMNQFDGMAASDGNLLRLNFERFGLKTRAGVELTAFGLGMPQNMNVNAKDKLGRSLYNPTPLTSFQIEIEINASAVAPELSAKARMSGPSPLGNIIKRRYYGYSPAGAGIFQISDIPVGDQMNRIWIFSDQISSVELQRDHFQVFKRTPAENNLVQSDGAKTPQANLFVIDPTEEGNGGEMIHSNVDDFRLLLDMAAADPDLKIYVDYIGGTLGN